MDITPLPIVKKCARCGGDHDEMFPTVYCWEETFRMFFGMTKDYAFELDPLLKAIHDRIVYKHNHTIDMLLDAIKQKEAQNGKD